MQSLVMEGFQQSSELNFMKVEYFPAEEQGRGPWEAWLTIAYM